MYPQGIQGVLALGAAAAPTVRRGTPGRLLGAARLAQIIGIVIVVGGVAGVALEPVELTDGDPVVHDLVVGAPHDDLQHREAEWPLRPTLAQTETSTPATVDLLGDALFRPRH